MTDEPHPMPEPLNAWRSGRPPLSGNAPVYSHVAWSDVVDGYVCYVPRMGLAPDLARPLPKVEVAKQVEDVLAEHDLKHLLGGMRLVAQSEIAPDADYVIQRRLPLAAFETRVRHPRTGYPVSVFFFVELNGMVRRIAFCRVVPTTPPTGGNRSFGGGGSGGGGGLIPANDEAPDVRRIMPGLVAQAPASLATAREAAARRLQRRLAAEWRARGASKAPEPVPAARPGGGRAIVAAATHVGDATCKPAAVLGRRVALAPRPINGQAVGLMVVALLPALSLYMVAVAARPLTRAVELARGSLHAPIAMGPLPPPRAPHDMALAGRFDGPAFLEALPSRRPLRETQAIVLTSAPAPRKTGAGVDIAPARYDAGEPRLPLGASTVEPASALPAWRLVFAAEDGQPFAVRTFARFLSLVGLNGACSALGDCSALVRPDLTELGPAYLVGDDFGGPTWGGIFSAMTESCAPPDPALWSSEVRPSAPMSCGWNALPWTTLDGS